MTAFLLFVFLSCVGVSVVGYGAYKLFGPAIKARLNKEVAKVSDKIVGE